MTSLLVGRVVSGLGEGRHLGFPTANLELLSGSRPPAGIYLARGKELNQDWRPGLLVSGVHWEGKDVPRIEVYLLDFNGNLYGRELQVEVLKKIREVLKINDSQALRQRIEQDIAEAKVYFKSG